MGSWRLISAEGRSTDDYFGYFGTYKVEERAGVVTFHVEGAAYPN